MAWGLLIFLVGIGYGFLSRGREAKMALFITGVFIGLILALVSWLLGGLQGIPTGTGTLGIVVGVTLLTLLFVLGAWVGDMFEGVFRHKRYA